MARIEINFPSGIVFSTELTVRITDINYGGHLGNDKILSMMHEARMQFLNNYQYTELNIEGAGLIMGDAAIQFKSEAFFGDVIKIEIALSDFARVSFDIYYRFTINDKLVTLGKTGMIFFDYQKRKIISCPESFVTRFS